MMKHTPRPWRVEIDQDAYLIKSGKNHLIAVMEGTVGEYGNDEYDAHLMKASPDLYDTLEKIAHGPVSADKTVLLIQMEVVKEMAREAIGRAVLLDYTVK